MIFVVVSCETFELNFLKYMKIYLLRQIALKRFEKGQDKHLAFEMFQVLSIDGKFPRFSSGESYFLS